MRKLIIIVLILANFVCGARSDSTVQPGKHQHDQAQQAEPRKKHDEPASYRGEGAKKLDPDNGLQPCLLPSFECRPESNGVVIQTCGPHPLIPYILTRKIEDFLLLSGEPGVVLRQVAKGTLAQGVRPFGVPLCGRSLRQKDADQTQERVLHFLG